MKVVKAFFHKHEAEMAKGLLAEAGIEAIVSADDVGGFRPDLTLGMGNVRLLVQDSDFERAKEVLKVLEEPDDTVKEMEASTEGTLAKVGAPVKRPRWLILLLIFAISYFCLTGIDLNVLWHVPHRTNDYQCDLVPDDPTITFCRCFFTNGNVQWEGHYLTDGGANGVSREFFPDGRLRSEKTYKDGILEGEFKAYYQNGQLERYVLYKEDKAQGEALEYYESGKLKRIATFKDDNLHGSLKTYFETGNLMEDLFYVDGRRINEDGTHFSGVDKTYYESGKIWEEFTYKDGLEDGLWREYFESGRLKSEARLKNNKYDGVYREFYENGMLKFEGKYSNNNLITEKDYDSLGNLIFEWNH